MGNMFEMNLVLTIFCEFFQSVKFIMKYKVTQWFWLQLHINECHASLSYIKLYRQSSVFISGEKEVAGIFE